MFMPREALNHHHPNTAIFVWAADRKIRRLEEEEARAGTEMDFQVYKKPLETVTPYNSIIRLLNLMEDE